MSSVHSQGSPTKTLKKRTSSFDNFILDSRLTKGKFTIYKAWKKSNYEPVILKIFPSSNDANNLFKSEQRVLSVLNHPNIVQLKAMDTNVELRDNQFYSYLALEYAGFGDLLQLILTHGEMPEKLARSLFRQMIEGISHMHENGVSHLDLKLENLLLDEKFKLKITDFDFSQFFGETLKNRGSPCSRAPEVKEGTATNFVAADVFSMALILFSMITANPAFSEVSEHNQLVFNAFYPLLRNDNEQFWKVHSSIKQKEDMFGRELISLLNWMWSENAENRPSIQNIKQHSWYNQDLLSEEEYILEMKKYLKIKTK